MIPSLDEIISKIIIAAIIAVLTMMCRSLRELLVRNWPGLRLALKAGAKQLDKFLDKKAFGWHLRLDNYAFEQSYEPSYRQLLLLFGRLSARSMEFLFYLLGVCCFYLGIVVHHYSVEKALLLLGMLSLTGRFMRWYMNKMIAA